MPDEPFHTPGRKNAGKRGGEAEVTLELRAVVVIESRAKGVGLFADARYQGCMLFGAETRGLQLPP
jgi:hypothetical protein